MLNKIKKAAILTTLVVVVLSVSGLCLAKYLDVLPDIHPKLIVSGLTNFATQIHTYLSISKYRPTIEIICANVFICLMLITRASLVRRFLS
jgi:hypothetical protein